MLKHVNVEDSLSIPKPAAPDKPGQHPASTEIGQVSYPKDAGTTGTRDFQTDGHQLPDPDIAQQTAPIDTRDRSDGGHLDRSSWAYDFSRRHHLSKPERAVLLYMAHRASPQRLFQCDDSEEQIADWTDYERKAINRAIKGLINKGAIYQTRRGKGGNHVPSRYRLRGNETAWRVEETPDTPNETSEAIGNPQWDSGGHWNAPNGTPGDFQCDPESIPMRPGVPYHPDHHPVLPPVVSSFDETTTTTTPDTKLGQAKSSLSSDSQFENHRISISNPPDPSKTCENCDEQTFRSYRWCIPHLVGLFWSQLGPTWTKGPRVASRWYKNHPDDFEEQLREASVGVPSDSRGIGDVDAEESSATTATPARPPDLGGGTFRCNCCGLTQAFDVAFDGAIHRDYPERDSDGNVARIRCGGTWERICELDEEPNTLQV